MEITGWDTKCLFLPHKEAQTVSTQSHPGMEVPWMLMLSPLPPGHTLFYLLAQLPSSYFNYLLFPSSGVDTR